MSKHQSAAHDKTLLRLFLVSIAVNASLGIWTLLLGEFGEIQGKILLTSFFVSAAMLAILANGAPLKNHVLWPLPAWSAASAAAGFLLFIAVIWSEADSDWPPKLATSALILGGGGTLIGLLQLIRIPSTVLAIRVMSSTVIVSLCVTTIFGLWYETESDWILRLIGVEAVLAAALALAIPALSRFQPTMPPVQHPEVSIRFCPSCGEYVGESPLDPDSVLSCPGCGLHFAVLDKRSVVRDPLTTTIEACAD